MAKVMIHAQLERGRWICPYTLIRQKCRQLEVEGKKYRDNKMVLIIGTHNTDRQSWGNCIK